MDITAIRGAIVTLPSHPPPARRSAPRLSYLLSGTLVTCLTVFLLAPGLLGSSLDGGVYALMGSRIAAGDVPYVDVWDHKPPGIYLVNALGDLVSGSAGSWQVAWVISVAAVVLTSLIVADMLRRLGWRRSAWVAGIACAVELASFPLARGGGLTETLAVLPAVVAIRLVGVEQRTAGRAFAAGLCAGGAIAISLQLVPVLVAALAMVMVRARTGVRAAWSRLAWVVVGAAMLWTVLLALLVTVGVTMDAALALVRYNAAYARLGGRDDPFVDEAIHGVLVLSPLAIGAVLGLRRSLVSSRLRPMAVGALVWIAGSAALIVAQGRMELHYLAPLAVPLSLLLPASQPRRAPTTRRVGLAASAIAASVLVAAASVSILLISTETVIALGVRSRQAARDTSVAGWIEARAPLHGTLFVWGNRPQLYTLTQRAPASRYVYLLPLLTPGFTSDQMVSDVIGGWRASPPAVIVDAGSAGPGVPGMPALLIPRLTEVGDNREVDLLDPLRDFVRERYVLAVTLEGWPIYVSRGAWARPSTRSASGLGAVEPTSR
jgi:hypothetical protein